MKVYDHETDLVHKAIEIDFLENKIVMYSKEYGFTSNTLDKVSFIMEEEDPKILEI